MDTDCRRLPGRQIVGSCSGQRTSKIMPDIRWKAATVVMHASRLKPMAPCQCIRLQGIAQRQVWDPKPLVLSTAPPTRRKSVQAYARACALTSILQWCHTLTQSACFNRFRVSSSLRKSASERPERRHRLAYPGFTQSLSCPALEPE